MCECYNPNPFVNPCKHLAAEIAATPVDHPSPAQIPAMMDKAARNRRIREQAKQTRAKVNRVRRARENGYYGPLTRSDLIRQMEQRARG